MTEPTERESNTPPFTIKLPSQDQLRINLRKLHSKDYSGMEAQQAFDEIETLTGEILHPCVRYFSPLTLYRARVQPFTEEEETQIRSFLSPPPNLATLQRGNMHGSPVFYGSLDQETPCKETGKGPGDPIWIAQFELKKDCVIWVRDFSIKNSNTTAGPGIPHAIMRQHVREIVEGIDGNFRTEHTAEHILEAIEEMPFTFVMEHYELSARLAHYWLYVTKRDVQAVLYSSNKDYSRYNLAVHPQVIVERFTLESVIKCFYDSNTGIFTFDKEGKPSTQDDSQIEWQDCRHWGKGRFIDGQFVTDNLDQLVSLFADPDNHSMSICFDLSDEASREEAGEFLSRLEKYKGSN